MTVRNRPTRVRCPNAIPTAHVRATQHTRRSRVPVQEVTVAAHARHNQMRVIKTRAADTARVHSVVEGSRAFAQTVGGGLHVLSATVDTTDPLARLNARGVPLPRAMGTAHVRKERRDPAAVRVAVRTPARSATRPIPASTKASVTAVRSAGAGGAFLTTTTRRVVRLVEAQPSSRALPNLVLSQTVEGLGPPLADGHSEVLVLPVPILLMHRATFSLKSGDYSRVAIFGP